eukprot:6756359-Pyramimonas_sp.AAC.1
MLGPRGNLLALAWGPVWNSCPQTPQAGEFAAYAMAGALVSAPSQLYSDCANVASMHGMQDLQRLSPKRPYAGFVLQGRSLGGKGCLGVRRRARTWPQIAQTSAKPSVLG